jgi:hypothetical protein
LLLHFDNIATVDTNNDLEKDMKATITKTVDGYKVFTDEMTDLLATYFSNGGGIQRDGHHFFWASDAGYKAEHIIESLKDEGYEITQNALI